MNISVKYYQNDEIDYYHSLNRIPDNLDVEYIFDPITNKFQIKEIEQNYKLYFFTSVQEINNYDIVESIYFNYRAMLSLPNLPINLQVLHCSDCCLSSLPKLPNSLKELYCDHNQLSSLPKLPISLEILDCNSNKLTSLPKLPESIKELVISNKNKIKWLPNIPKKLYKNDFTKIQFIKKITHKYLYIII